MIETEIVQTFALLNVTLEDMGWNIDIENAKFVVYKHSDDLHYFDTVREVNGFLMGLKAKND